MGPRDKKDTIEEKKQFVPVQKVSFTVSSSQRENPLQEEVENKPETNLSNVIQAVNQ
ncbi:hypothetical protein [Wolbachia endosymbiont of Mansonella perstans]|uniref:hypothetical protein n=1 Tax=Wolbachia endosymbiont of Mansonella perstans TaxID=229526 RepID=UPI001CE0E65A|nr:hypothetical protein [Wolbachia endosymbiont of Mansonella perstans]MCA4774447.1 hypothetical protein [Wolbachia endosymbiont of Mansonella perstans]